MRTFESGHIRGSPVAIVLTKAKKYPDGNGMFVKKPMSARAAII